MQTKRYRFLLTLRHSLRSQGIALILLSSLALLSPLTAFAQSDAQIRITQVDNSNFPNVIVYASVTNSAGDPIGVDPSTIQISENGAVMTPVDLRGGGDVGGGAIPVTTMLVIDISGSMDKNGKLDAAKEAGKKYVSQMRPGDQVGLMTYDTQVYNVQPVTTDIAKLTSAIDGLKTGTDTAMYNALIKAEKNLESVSGRKAIIVLTDGLDNKSQSTADDVIAGISQSGLTISAIGFGDAGVTGQTGLDEAGLKSLSEKTGGLYSFATDVQSLTAFYQQYGRSLQSEYAITYVSPSTLRDGINRALTVSLATPGGQISQEAGYNPGGVLPEVPGQSWTLFGLIFAGLLVLLIVPVAISRGAGLFGRTKPKGRIKLSGSSSPAPAASKNANIKVK
ncbi:MAG: VWA domain-containing protein [Anaerolineales bacterium]|nr:VWA domain-containing protein [Anaerolineales bacterium]